MEAPSAARRVLFFVTALISVALLLGGDLWSTRYSYFPVTIRTLFYSLPTNRARDMEKQSAKTFCENLSQKGSGCPGTASVDHATLKLRGSAVSPVMD